ncbi:MAG: AAA family ATPase [Pseudobdellovibrionaceae bacterium]
MKNNKYNIENVYIPNYEITEGLGESPLAFVYKGYHKQQPGQTLVLKVFKPGILSNQRRRYFMQKIEHLKILTDSRVAPPLRFEEYGNQKLLVRDYFPGIPISEWVHKQETLNLEDFFSIALKLADIIDSIQKSGIIHGGIKPHNIIVEPKTLDIKIVDFITPLDIRNISHFIYDKNFIEGTLAYTSPEQTGRINHRVDFTTDIYSLGIIFYELLTGRLPFFSTDPLELIHSHLAEEAPTADILNPAVPPIVGKIISKLMLKQPEKRYQSGSGLYADLYQCMQQWLQNKKIEDFSLGTKDRTHRVTFVSKMVGRDDEAQIILNEYTSVAQGHFRSVFISGFSGIGKTRLIQELQRPIVKNQGYFTSGKFDVYQKNIPYSSLIQAFRNLTRTFLTENDERVAKWKNKILQAVGTNGRVITDVVPELEILIGPQPEVKALPPVESRNRFQDVFGKYLSCLASAENPLVLFIDDLQWCDLASFELLTTIYNDHQNHPYLFLIGAYRHNEVDSAHPLTKMKEPILQTKGPLQEIQLGPLDTEHTHEMVSYILDSPLEETEILANFISDLTEGNPLFVSEILSYLYNENLLYYVDEDKQWRWNMEKIRSSNMPSSVVLLFSAKIQKLPAETIRLLEYCACMGNLFTPDVIALVKGISLLETFETLKPALGQGLLMENKDQLQFVHDKVQEATLAAIPSEKRRLIHFEIGQLMFAQVADRFVADSSQLESLDELFTITSHINLGRKPVLTKEEQYQISTLNFHAGNKALDSLATEAANEYYKNSLNFLPDDCWTLQYERTFKIYQKLAKTELMVGEYESSERLLNLLLENARTDLDKAEALAEQTTSLSSIGNFIKAIETANRGLAFFKKSIPDNPVEAEKNRDFLMKQIHQNHPDVWSKILNMPFTNERKSKIELAFYSELIPDLYMSGLVPQLYLSAVQSTQHCLMGGMDESVIYSFSIMGLYLGEQEQFEEAFKYEDLAKNLSEKYPNTFGATRGMNGVVWCNMHSRNHPADIVKYCEKSIQSGKNCGDLYNAGLSYGPLMWNLAVQGNDLSLIENYARECLNFSQKYHLSFSVGLAEAVHAGWVHPMKKSYNGAINMDDKLTEWKENNHIASAGSYCVLRALSHYFFNEVDDCQEYLEKVNLYLNGLTDNVLKRQWTLFKALNALKLFEAKKKFLTKEALLDYVNPIIEKIEKWANLGPLLRPYLAFYYAERERILGNFNLATGLYLEAKDQASQANYTFLLAFINETLGKALLARNLKSTSSRLFLVEALRNYRKTKAERKEFALLEDFSFLNTVEAKDLGEPSEFIEAEDQTSQMGNLDIHYLMKSAMLISAEINTLSLHKKIMNVLLETSGAQGAYLVLEKDSSLYIAAESHIKGNDSFHSELYYSEKASPLPLEESEYICKSIIRYVHRTKETIILKNASLEGPFKENKEVLRLQLKSVYCIPLLIQNQMVGIIYLYNNLSNAVLTDTQIEITKLISSQAAISLQNANLVQSMIDYEKQLQHSLVEKEILIKEIHHRVKNNLQVISSLFNLQARFTKDNEVLTLLKESQNRVRSIAYVHEQLHKTDNAAEVDLKEYLGTLTDNLFRSYGIKQNQIKIYFNTADIRANIESCVSIGLIVNELLSNAIKYAFPNKKEEEKKIEITLGESGDNFYLNLKDNGIGIPADLDTQKTLGLQLVNVLSKQIRGTVSMKNSPGAEFHLTWPKEKNTEEYFTDPKIAQMQKDASNERT